MLFKYTFLKIGDNIEFICFIYKIDFILLHNYEKMHKQKS